MRPFWFWAGSAALASLVAAVPEPELTRQFEVDIVFPHNETYKPADTMPIVFAIQNTSIPGSLGSFYVNWQIRQLKGGQFNSISSGIVDRGYMSIARSDAVSSAGKPLFAVGFTNVTNWIQQGVQGPPATNYTPAVDDRYMLQWGIEWAGWELVCGEDLVGGSLPGDGALTFNIQTVWGKTDGTGWQGEIQDVQAGIPECPEFGGMLQMTPGNNASKPTCDDVEILDTRQGNPCGVTVDQAAASSISSLVSSSVLSSISSSLSSVSSSMSRYHSTSIVASSTSKAAAAGDHPTWPVQTALAAACVLCGLAL